MRTIVLVAFLALVGIQARAQVEESVALEGGASLARATQYLVESQGEDGLWSKHPGITGAAILALDHAASEDPAAQAAVTRGLAAIAKMVREDGSFRHPGSTDDVYSTSMCLLALSVAGAGDPELRPVIAKAAAWLSRAQKPAGPGYGGAGFRYTDNSYPDLSNTQWAAEAIYASSFALGQADLPPDARKMLAGAIAFIADCQVTEGPDAGAFGYFPADAKGATPHDEGVGEAKLWGSLTYGALKTFRYGGVLPTDDRVARGLAWAKAHNTITENPGLKDGGYYYYLYMYATTRNQYRQQFGDTWQRPLIEALLSRQKGDGYWQNENPLWLERDPVLCTAYATFAMSIALQP